MAFSLRNLSVLAYANGFTLWHYKGHGDTLVTISDGNYFGNANSMLTAGDMVLISASDGASIKVITSVDREQVAAAPLS